MLYPECTRFAYSRYDVEADGCIQAEVLDIGIGRYDNTSYFLPVHGILRLNVIRIATGFQFLIFVGYNIQLKVILPPVTVTYGVTVLFQVFGSGVFTGFSKDIVSSHYSGSLIIPSCPGRKIAGIFSTLPFIPLALLLRVLDGTCPVISWIALPNSGSFRLP